MPENKAVTTETLSNGLTLIVEEMSQVESVAYELFIPGGIVCDDEKYIGSSLILAELSSRGAGSFNSKEISDEFDKFGIRHSEGGGHDRFSYRGALIGTHLEEAFKLVSLMVREPKLSSSELPAIKSVLLQDIVALHDNPARRSMVELAARYYPAPYGRSVLGTKEGLEACSSDQQRCDWEKRFAPAGSILSVAGNCRAKDVVSLTQRYFGDWKGKAQSLPSFGKVSQALFQHVHYESAQLQIACAYPSSPFGHRFYFPAKVATGVLSGGMSGRLFVEVREKRGLCYSVYARHSATKDYGTVMAYAGTTPERAQETLTVLMEVLRSLKGSVTEDELLRAKTGLKASLVIGEETSSARASSNAQDWWLDKRVRSLDEIINDVNKVTKDDIDAYINEFSPKNISILTLGARELGNK